MSADQANPVAAYRPSGLSMLIPYRNPAAISAYYMGILALFPVLGFVLAPIPIIFGVYGWRVSRRDPSVHGFLHALVGLVLGLLSLLAQPFLTYLLWWIYQDDIRQYLWRE